MINIRILEDIIVSKWILVAVKKKSTKILISKLYFPSAYT